jgi:hypothetical protein
MRRKKRTGKPENPADITDLEVARKMIKIFQSAQDRKLEFDLSFKTVKQLLSYPTCYYTGKEFEEDGMMARSFDRIDSDKGYVEGNVVACTVDINSKKSNLTFEEIETLYFKLSQVKKDVQDEIFDSLANSSPESESVLAEPEQQGISEDRLSEEPNI